MAEREKGTSAPSKLAHLPRRPMFAKMGAEAVKSAADRAANRERATPAQKAAQVKALQAAADRAASTSKRRSAEAGPKSKTKTPKGASSKGRRK